MKKFFSIMLVAFFMLGASVPALAKSYDIDDFQVTDFNVGELRTSASDAYVYIENLTSQEVTASFIFRFVDENGHRVGYSKETAEYTFSKGEECKVKIRSDGKLSSDERNDIDDVILKEVYVKVASNDNSSSRVGNLGITSSSCKGGTGYITFKNYGSNTFSGSPTIYAYSQGGSYLGSFKLKISIGANSKKEYSFKVDKDSINYERVSYFRLKNTSSNSNVSNNNFGESSCWYSPVQNKWFLKVYNTSDETHWVRIEYRYYFNDGTESSTFSTNEPYRIMFDRPSGSEIPIDSKADGIDPKNVSSVKAVGYIY